MDPKEKALRELINTYPGETVSLSFLVLHISEKLGATPASYDQMCDEVRHYLAALRDAGNMRWDEDDQVIMQWLTPATIPSDPTTKQLEDSLEDAMIQVILVAGSVCHDTDNPMHNGMSHYLVEKELMGALRQAIAAYDAANEALIIRMSGVVREAFSPEM